jgi:hypothetical protein
MLMSAKVTRVRIVVAVLSLLSAFAIATLAGLLAGLTAREIIRGATPIVVGWLLGLAVWVVSLLRRRR